MKESDPVAYPEWTELRKKRGLDPLGMQNSSVVLYQSLVPGISNVTLRIRYYGFYAWLCASYARNIGDTNPQAWQRFIRRAEALYALVAQRKGGEGGVAGTEWAERTLQATEGEVIAFADDAEPGSATHYLKQAWGAYGAAYASQLFEVGVLSTAEAHSIPVPSKDLGEPLAIIFAEELGPIGEQFVQALARGTVTKGELDSFAPMTPSAIRPDGAERDLYERMLFARVGLNRESDEERAQTLLLIVQLLNQLGASPTVMDIRWALYAGCTYDGTALMWPNRELELQCRKWWVYQANDLSHICLEALLKYVLDALEPHRAGVPLSRLIGNLIEEIISVSDRIPITWEEFLKQCAPAENAWSLSDPLAEYALARALIQAGREGGTCRAEDAWKALQLLAVLHNRTNFANEGVVHALNRFDPNAFRSLLTEYRFLEAHVQTNFSAFIGKLLEERVIRRHLWVALRKFRYQGDYTFLIETDDGLIRLRAKDGPVFTNPRLGPALTFLKDIDLLGSNGLTARGRNLIEAT